MPTSSNNLLGLIIVSIGILGVVISFLITDRKRYLTALLLSGLVVSIGLFQSVRSSVRQWQANRRFAKLQEQQRLNLQALQERLRQAQENAAGAKKSAETAKK
jgi:hypothetical protein